MPRTARWTCSTASNPAEPGQGRADRREGDPGLHGSRAGIREQRRRPRRTGGRRDRSEPDHEPRRDRVLRCVHACLSPQRAGRRAAGRRDVLEHRSLRHRLERRRAANDRGSRGSITVDPEGSVTDRRRAQEGKGAPLRCLQRGLPRVQLTASGAGLRRRLHRPGRGVGRAGPRARVRVGPGQQRLRDAAGEQRDSGRAAQPVPCRPHHADRRQEPRPAAELARHLRPRDRQRQGQGRHSQLAEPLCPLPAGLDRDATRLATARRTW